MKLLHLSINGINLFRDGLELDFIARQRVTDNNSENLTHLFSSIYKQDILGIIGINASGKTTALRWISLILDIYLREGKVNDKDHRVLLQNQTITAEAYFSDGINLYKIQSLIKPAEDGEPIFDEERLWIKKQTKTLSRIKLLEFTDHHLDTVRSKEELSFLSDYMSIMISLKKKHGTNPIVVDQLQDTNINLMRVIGDVPTEVIQFLDDNIEYVSYDGNSEGKIHIQLKFKNKEDIIYIYDPLQLPIYLSSGTIKGLNVFAGIENVMASGGFLIVDELENHFNEAIVRMIIQMFKHKDINVMGATLIFTTHYAALLDEFDRNDTIYISFKEETLHLKNMYDLLDRNDFKKSDVYQSSYLGKTAPSYEAYMGLKNYFLQLGKNIRNKMESK
ncbi:hypothetical protein GCM10028778_22150 [Barrientosiimonas marina]|uniref:ATP/GTP-binding protein n=1 Tax=Lentibacillus kimchii TaxID=1542911 RepID=A0ABW2URT9_9BACI